MTAEQVWLVLVEVDTGRPRTGRAGLATDFGILLDLIRERVVTLDGDRLICSGAGGSTHPLSARQLTEAAGGDPLDLAQAVNVIHPTWPALARAAEARGWATQRTRRFQRSRFVVEATGRAERDRIVQRARDALAVGPEGEIRDLISALWAANVAEFGLSRSTALTDHEVLDGVRACFDDDPLTEQMAAVAAVMGAVNFASASGTGAPGQPL